MMGSRITIASADVNDAWAEGLGPMYIMLYNSIRTWLSKAG